MKQWKKKSSNVEESVIFSLIWKIFKNKNVIFLGNNVNAYSCLCVTTFLMQGCMPDQSGHFSLSCKWLCLEQGVQMWTQWKCSQMWGLPYNGLRTFWSCVFSVPASEACWPLIHRHSQGNGVITKTHAVYKYELHADLVSVHVSLSHIAAQISPIRQSLI